MAKRFAVSCFIVLGVCIFMVAGFALVLFLAPGFSAFGIKYIAIDTHVVNEKLIVTDEIGSFTGSVIVETSEIPIQVVFTQDRVYEVEYFDNYNGLTTSKFDDPSITLTRDANGNAVVKVKEFTNFLYESSSSERYLKILVPLAAVVGDTSAFRTNLTITSKTSNIEFLKEIEDLRIPQFNTVKIKTSGRVKFNDEVQAKTYNYSTNSSIIIGKSKKSAVNAENYILKSRDGRIELNRAVTGDVTATTNNGRIELVSCKNLTATTGFGNISAVDNKKSIQISGSVKIKTKSGNVILGDVNGVADNNIKTGSGKIIIGKIKNGSIKSTCGSIEIKSVNDMKIESNVGRVDIEEVLTKVDVETKRGNVHLGGELMTVNNATVFSRLGNVDIESSTGKIKITTIAGRVDLKNTSSEDVTIESGGRLKATNLKGSVNIKAYDDVNLKIADITENITVEVASSVKKVKIEALNNYYTDIRYLMRGKRVTRYGDNGTGEFSRVDYSDSHLDTSMIGTGPLLKVVGLEGQKSKASVSLYMLIRASE